MTRTSPRTLFISFALVLLAVHGFIAAPVHAQEVPFEGVVAEDDVKARAGAGRTFYIVGALPKGTKVTVDEVIFGWHKVQPSTGIYSYISKAFVDAKGDGKVGEVNKDGSPVNAASLDGPGDSYRNQLNLNKGDSVQIVGEDGSFYKIVPPNLGATKRAYVYLPPGSIRREVADTGKPAPVTPPADPSTPKVETPATPKVDSPATPKVDEPATPKVDTPDKLAPMPADGVLTPKTDDPATPKTDVPAVTIGKTDTPIPATVAPKTDVPAITVTPAPATPAAPTDTKIDVPTPASLQKFESDHASVKELEAKMIEAFRLPIEKQPADELLAAFNTALTLPGLTTKDRVTCNARILQLTRIAQVQAAIKRSKVTPAEDPKLPEPPATGIAGRAASYDATGQLMASSVYDGVRLPTLFRVVEPSSNRTIVYVRPGPQFESTKALGRLVGITGKINFDSSLNLRIIEIDKIDVLDVADTKAKEAAATTTRVVEKIVE